MEYKDLAGNEIHVGDFITYAASWGRCPILKYGLVTRLATRKEAYVYAKAERSEIPTLRVIAVDRTWKNNWEIQNKGKEITLGFLDRLLVIPRTHIPDEAFALLITESLRKNPK